MSTENAEKGRRLTPKAALDIDRRTAEATRRDDVRRVWLEEAYEHIYLPAYMNMFHPSFESRVHAFSNLIEEPSSVEWLVQALAEADGKAKLAPKTIREFAKELIQQGLVQNEQGQSIDLNAMNSLNASLLLLKSA